MECSYGLLHGLRATTGRLTEILSVLWERLPGATLIQQLRDEAANIKAQKTGEITQTQQANLATLKAIELARQQSPNGQS